MLKWYFISSGLNKIHYQNALISTHFFYFISVATSKFKITYVMHISVH